MLPRSRLTEIAVSGYDLMGDNRDERELFADVVQKQDGRLYLYLRFIAEKDRVKIIFVDRN